jgi:2-hydroxy-3-oxopropionate reductase
MGASAVRCGDVGAGNAAKLCNQIVVASNITAVAEALMLGKKLGVSPDLVYQAIRGGLAGSTVMDAKAPMMMDRNFKPGFKIDLHIKDLNNVLDAARVVDAPTPLTAGILEMMKVLHGDGEGQSDHSALAKYYEKLAGVEITR